MKLFCRCLAPKRTRTLHVPSLADISRRSYATFEKIWRWCVDRNANKMFLACVIPGDKCEHTEGCCEAYVASMFILREGTRRPRLIELPLQYDELYSSMTGRHCTRCMKTPCDPGLCLICGDYLCCGDSCCTLAFIPHGSPVGECTRHAAECGGGEGFVLLLERCRVALVGGSMAAYFPNVYVDFHGEEDVGLQPGRPLRLDWARYAHLESLWRTHRIFTEVSRLRKVEEQISGVVSARGEQPVKSLINPGAMACLSVVESLTNMVWVDLGGRGLRDCKCLANLMWAAKLPNEASRMYECCEAMNTFMKEVGVAVDDGNTRCRWLQG
ncbi:hypothetical protein PsorP6_008961 [Peronosclerospora sorghi]|uniref:Uncharacterized protein n=1 Tax=Peronosclerospora sorghi TaxID=230839 RepID=A0ACC0W083_9STRA|nr:hypothetical protein PsorP6_008961 [Peronosclerospora sorghi]